MVGKQIDQIAKEDRLAAIWMGNIVMPLAPRTVLAEAIAELCQQGFGLSRTAMDIANQIKRTGIIAEGMRSGTLHTGLMPEARAD